MTRGLLKSASVAALGLALSTSAFAADLGGNCCADLEERVAELEATTARKGTRKTSLTIYGWVNKTIMHWDAPARGTEPTRGTYLGQDNTNSATRFGFRGDAAIRADLKAGYSILIDVASGARTATSTRQDEDLANANVGGINDHGLRVRDANVFLESSRLGRATLGRFTGAGSVGTIDLAGIGNVAPGTILSGNGLTFSDGTNLGLATDLVADLGYRQDGLRWDSPTWAGFVVSASIGETTKKNGTVSNPTDQGRVDGVQVRYAGEFNGVRVAAGIGVERSDDVGTSAPANTTARNFGGSLSLMHVATGLFIQGTATNMERSILGVKVWDEDIRIVQAGLSRNFFGIGATVLYGEYQTYDIGFSTLAASPASKTNVWGLGVVQNIDAAAMQLYAGYRSHERDLANGASTGDIGVFLAGARINF